MEYEFIIKMIDDIIYNIVSFVTNASEVMLMLSVAWVVLVIANAVSLIKKYCEKIKYQTMFKESIDSLMWLYSETSNQKRHKNNGIKTFLIKVFKCYVINGIFLVLVLSLPFIIIAYIS